MGRHAIIVLKNKEEKYLQYYESKWESYLFLNCKMIDENDYQAINNKINEMLDIDSSLYNISYINTKVHTKYSVKDKIDKEYTHYFYSFEFNEKFDFFDLNEFERNGIKFKWFSYDDLLNDKRIQEVNSDIVSFIKEFNM